jgi:hypothetical protein
VETRKSQMSFLVLENRFIMRFILAFIFILICCFGSPAQQKNYFFYHPVVYGSDATFNPISLIANGGFDELQAYWRPSYFKDLPWKYGPKNVIRNITAPLPQINKYGWSRFISNEIIPTSLRMDDAQYFPNYTLHLIGGGMAYRKAAEWFDHYGYPVPMIFGAVTAMSYHFINEIIENGDGYFVSNVDPIADLLFFDPLGIVLFSFDGVCEFFSSDVKLNDWNSQPAFSFGPLGIRNTGQNFILRYPITESGKTSILYHFGSFGELGLSFKTNNEDAVSFGLGLTSKQVYKSGDNGDAVKSTIKVGPRGGLYWDRNGSLMASFVLSDNFHDFLHLNIYPGVFSIGLFSPGVFLLLGEKGRTTIGVTASFLPVGISQYFNK